MKKITLLFFLSCTLMIRAQNSIQEEINSRLVDLHKVEGHDENFAGFERIKNAIGDAKIVMLGEQSHTDATTIQTKIKLIKYLHQEMGFEILAFESGIYDCNKAWSMIQEGHDVKDAMAKGIFDIWSVLEELNPLYEYFEQSLVMEKPFMLTGFDTQMFARWASDYFGEDLNKYLTTLGLADQYENDISQLESFITKRRSGKKIKKKKAIQSMAFLETITKLIKEKESTEQSDFWVQTLKSMKVYMSDYYLETDDRDQQMAQNLIWLKEKYPNKKIICWGATSHFLYNSSLVKMEDKRFQKDGDDYYLNHSMMGDYIKEKYGDEVYTIGFIAHEGTFGFNRTRTIDMPKENSLEFLVGKSENDNYFLPLKNLSLEGYLSRPLGHQNMTSDISKMMDGVVFNRHMRRPYTDWEFLFYLTPENKMWAKKKERFIEFSKQRKEERKKKEAAENKNRA